MAFEIILGPTTASPPPARVQMEVRRAIAAAGGAFDADGEKAHTAEGIRFEFADGDRLVVDRLSPGLCRIIFNAALRTRSTVDRGGADVMPLRVKGVTAPTRYIRLATDPISSPETLCVRLNGDLIAWNGLVREAQAEGTMGPDEELLEPPASPGSEPRLSSDVSDVGARCLASASPLTGKAGWRIERTVLSQNPQYGVVWRADVVTARCPDIQSRLMCWRLPHSDKVTLEVRPLEMFDPAQSERPLEPEAPPNGPGR